MGHEQKDKAEKAGQEGKTRLKVLGTQEEWQILIIININEAYFHWHCTFADQDDALTITVELGNLKQSDHAI